MEDASRKESTFKRHSPGRRAFSGPRLYAGALLTSGAAAVHFAVAPEHFQEYLPFGIFFVLAGAAQLVLAGALLVSPSRRLLALAAAGTAAMVAVWLISRTAGVPIGPRPWVAEGIGIPDVACVAMEMLSVLFFVLLLRRRARPRPRRLLGLTLATVPAALLTAALTAVGVSASVSGMPVAFDASPMVAGRTSTTVDLLTERPGPQPVRSFTLTAGVTRVGGAVAWTYNGSVPGPELRAVQGDRLRVTLVNRLPAATTLHWHGLRVPNAEDGVAGITQQAVPPGHSFSYEFVVRDAGTYWYHSHQDTQAQLGAGLYGALVVEPPSGHVAEAHDYTVMLHNAPGSGAVSVNGMAGDLHLPAGPGETVRLRLINAVVPGMDGGPEAPVLLGAPYRVVSLDGRDLNGPQLVGPERLALGMGQRADLAFTMPAAGSVRLVDTEVQGETSAIQGFFPRTPPPRLSVTLGSGPSPAAAGAAALPLFDPTRYGLASQDAVAAARPAATYSLVLAKNPGFHGGTVQLVHTINGVASPNVPPITVHEGQVIRLKIVNDTAEYHPMHLHGHVFSVLARNGRPVQGTPIHLDSVLLGPHESWEVAFLADNPGIWMLHCHVLLHASMGMMMTVNYADVWTPYTMGSASGNVPE